MAKQSLPVRAKIASQPSRLSSPQPLAPPLRPPHCRTAAPPHRRLPRPPRAHQQLSWREQHHDRHMLLQASPWRPSQEHVPSPCPTASPAPPAAGSLGLLEEWAVRLCALQRTLRPALHAARLVVFAADHGVTLEGQAPGVSAYPRGLTASVFRAVAGGGAASAALCGANGVSLGGCVGGWGGRWSCGRVCGREGRMRAAAGLPPAWRRAPSQLHIVLPCLTHPTHSVPFLSTPHRGGGCGG